MNAAHQRHKVPREPSWDGNCVDKRSDVHRPFHAREVGNLPELLNREGALVLPHARLRMNMPGPFVLWRILGSIVHLSLPVWDLLPQPRLVELSQLTCIEDHIIVGVEVANIAGALLYGIRERPVGILAVKCVLHLH